MADRGRPRSDPTQLLRRLEAALKKAKPRDVVSLSPMAQMCGMTARNLQVTYIDQDPNFPIQKRGGEGVAWELRPTVVLRYLIKRTKAKEAEVARKAHRIAEMTGVKVDSDQRFDVGDLSKLIDLTLKTQKAKQDQGAYVPAEKMAQFVADYNRTLSSGLLSIPGKVDEVGRIPVEVRAAIDEHIRALAVAMTARAEKFLGEYGAGSYPGATG
jgi:hypothetical protein